MFVRTLAFTWKFTSKPETHDETNGLKIKKSIYYLKFNQIGPNDTNNALHTEQFADKSKSQLSIQLSHHKLNGKNFPCLGSILKRISAAMFKIIPLKINRATRAHRKVQESPANAKGTRDSSACMKAHCEQM